MEQLVKIELFGQQYTFKAEEEVSRAKEVADLLAAEVSRIESQQSSSSSSANKLTVLIIAALNIANENIKLKRNYSNFLQNISNRSIGLIRVLDENVQ
ncbi:cell division protein ZapA [Thermodesulfobacteriota bacterium]